MSGPVLEFAMRDDGRIEVVSPWFPLAQFAPEVVALLERRGWGRREGSELTILCSNGGARYRLGEEQTPGGALPARLVETWA